MKTNVLFLDDEIEMSGEIIEYAKKQLDPNEVDIKYFDGVEKIKSYLTKLAPMKRKAEKFLMVLDLNLDGDIEKVLSLISEVKGNNVKLEKSKKAIPIVVFSHSPHQTDIDRCYGSGANMYVQRGNVDKMEKQFVEIIDLYNTFAKSPDMLYKAHELSS